MFTKISRAMAIAGLLGASTAWALPSVPGGEPILIQFTNAEQVCATNCITANNTGVPLAFAQLGNEGNWGVINVSTMNLSGVAVANRLIQGSAGSFFNDDLTHSMGQISGIFYGIQLTSATTTTGGFLDLYYDAPGGGFTVANTITATPGQRTAYNQFTNFTDGVFLARLAFAWGINDDDMVTTVRSNIDPTGVGGTTATGEANSFANIVAGATDPNGNTGAWEGLFNTNYFRVGGPFSTGPCTTGLTFPGGVPTPTVVAGPCAEERRDFRFRNTFNDLPSWNGTAGILGLSSTDPATTFTAIPEPTVLALLGLGLMGLGLGSRRKAAG